MVNNTRITVLLRREKGYKGLNAGYMNVRHITSHEAPRITALLRAFLKEQRAMALTRGKLTRRWGITPRENKEMWSADTLT